LCRDYRLVLKKVRDAQIIKSVFILTEATRCTVELSDHDDSAVLSIASVFSGEIRLEGNLQELSVWKEMVEDCISKCKGHESVETEGLAEKAGVKVELRMFNASSAVLNYYSTLRRGRYFIRGRPRAIEISKDSKFAANGKDCRILPLTVDCSLRVLDDGTTLELFLGDTSAHVTLMCGDKADTASLYNDLREVLQQATARFRAPWYTPSCSALFFAAGPIVNAMWLLQM